MTFLNSFRPFLSYLLSNGAIGRRITPNVFIFFRRGGMTMESAPYRRTGSHLVFTLGPRAGASLRLAKINRLFQPGPRESPVPVRGPRRDVQGIRNLGNAQADEIPELDDLSREMIFLIQRIK